MYPRVVAGVAVVAIAGCGGNGDKQAPEKPAGKAGGSQAEQWVLDDLGLETARPHSSLSYCDGGPVKVVRVSGNEAVDTWRDLREEAGSSGLWPVLIGEPNDAAVLADVVRFNCKDGHTLEGVLQAASKVDIAAALSEVARIYGVRAKDLRGSKRLPDYRYSKDEFLVPVDVVTGEPLPEVGIALLPIREDWHATALLPWGNYNDNPGPAVHTAVIRDWGRRYDAELVSMTGDVIEMSVGRPPTTDRAALALAREQFKYAPDIVQQGVGDVETLAAALKDGHAWYFWWD